MSARWNLSNFFGKVSFAQFKDLSIEFKTAAEEAFNTECDVAINLMTRPRISPTFLDDVFFQGIDETNETNTFAKATDIASVTKKQWDNAAYVYMIVSPRDQDKAPQSSFSHLEFKGNMPKTATYYIQGPDDDVNEKTAAQIRQNHKFMRNGDGRKSNSHVVSLPV